MNEMTTDSLSREENGDRSLKARFRCKTGNAKIGYAGNRERERARQREGERERERQTDRQSDGDTQRQTNRPTNRPTDRPTHRPTDSTNRQADVCTSTVCRYEFVKLFRVCI